MKTILTIIMASAAFHSFGLCEEKKPVAASDIGIKLEIIGDLGVPVGKIVTITGQKQRNGPIENWFLVETVDGKRKKIGIQIDGISHWPDGTKAALTGTEVGTLKFLTLEMTNYGPKDSRWKGPYQQLFLGFAVDKIISPGNLDLKK